MLVLIRKAGRIGKDSIGAAKFLCPGIHYLYKSIHRTSHMFSYLQCDIIGRGNHDGI